MFKNPFSFKGRIRRKEYCLSYLIYMLIAVIMSLLSEAMLEGPSELLSIIALVVYIPLIWFMLAQGAKRCHDRDNSGWYMLIPFYIFWMMFAEGYRGDNSYGSDPKGDNIPNYSELLDDDMLKNDDYSIK